MLNYCYRWVKVALSAFCRVKAEDKVRVIVVVGNRKRQKLQNDDDDDRASVLLFQKRQTVRGWLAAEPQLV